MHRHHPQWKKVKELVGEKAKGNTIAVHSFYSYYNDDTSNICNIVETGGGAMRDIGCYCTYLSRFIYSCEPRRVFGHIEYNPQTKIDRLASGLLDFDIGISTFTCGTRLQPYQKVNIMGEPRAE